MRRFNLVRTEDFSGVSGTGNVGEGVVFSDGSAVLRWKTQFSSTCIYKGIEDVIRIHGHEGRTKVEFIDPISV